MSEEVNVAHEHQESPDVTTEPVIADEGGGERSPLNASPPPTAAILQDASTASAEDSGSGGNGNNDDGAESQFVEDTQPGGSLNMDPPSKPLVVAVAKNAEQTYNPSTAPSTSVSTAAEAPPPPLVRESSKPPVEIVTPTAAKRQFTLSDITNMAKRRSSSRANLNNDNSQKPADVAPTTPEQQQQGKGKSDVRQFAEELATINEKIGKTEHEIATLDEAADVANDAIARYEKELLNLKLKAEADSQAITDAQAQIRLLSIQKAELHNVVSEAPEEEAFQAHKVMKQKERELNALQSQQAALSKAATQSAEALTKGTARIDKEIKPLRARRDDIVAKRQEWRQRLDQQLTEKIAIETDWEADKKARESCSKRACKCSVM